MRSGGWESGACLACHLGVNAVFLHRLHCLANILLLLAALLARLGVLLGAGCDGGAGAAWGRGARSAKRRLGRAACGTGGELSARSVMPAVCEGWAVGRRRMAQLCKGQHWAVACEGACKRELPGTTTPLSVLRRRAGAEESRRGGQRVLVVKAILNGASEILLHAPPAAATCGRSQRQHSSTQCGGLLCTLLERGHRSHWHRKCTDDDQGTENRRGLDAAQPRARAQKQWQQTERVVA